MDPARKLATFDDLLALPEGERAEVLAGEIRAMPAPLPEHGLAQRALGSLVGGPYHDDHGRGGPGGWWILPEVDVQFDEHDVVRPDLAGWRRDRLPSPWGVRPIQVVPDWICEVTSPSNAGHDRVSKRELYARHGVRHYWIVDPSERTLEAMGLADDGWLVTGSYQPGDVARIAPFEEVELEVERLFPPRDEASD